MKTMNSFVESPRKIKNPVYDKMAIRLTTASGRHIPSAFIAVTPPTPCIN